MISVCGALGSQSQLRCSIRTELASLSVVTLWLLFATAAAAAPDVVTYFTGPNPQSRLQSFPYATYLHNVSFTDFTRLERDRQRLNQIGSRFNAPRLGDHFLCHLAEAFLAQYPIHSSRYRDEIQIAEQFIYQQFTVYRAIGYFLFSNIASDLKEQIDKGTLDRSSREVDEVIRLLEKNKVYVPLNMAQSGKFLSRSRKCLWGDKQSCEYLYHRLAQRLTEALAQVCSDCVPKTYTRLVLNEVRGMYPLAGGYAVHLFQIKAPEGKTIGHVIWMQRPNVRACYFSYSESGSVSAEFLSWRARTRAHLVAVTTGGYTNSANRPEGLTAQNGYIVNPVLMPDRDGLVVVDPKGGILVANLQLNEFILPQLATPLSLRKSVVSLMAFIEWLRDNQATVFQTHLLSFGDNILIDPRRAPNQLRERRILMLTRDVHRVIYHVLVDIRESISLSHLTQELYAMAKQRHQTVEAMLNLDVGSFDILEVYDERGLRLTAPLGQVPLRNATNLLVYTLE